MKYIFTKTLWSFLNDREYRQLLLTTFFVLALGSIVYRVLEGWSWIDSIYFSLITLTTIGYGDFSPQTTEGKLFTIFYILIGVGIILTFINTVYHHYFSNRNEDDSKQ